MLGAFQATRGPVSITRFRTRHVALMLAYLAFYHNRAHYRGDIGEMLWPDNYPEVMKRNVRQALSSLRRHLEPPPLPPGSIVMVKQANLQVNPDLVQTDVQEFEALIAEAGNADSDDERKVLLERAISLYKGELLPGYYEDWVLSERQRLEDVYLEALKNAISLAYETASVQDAIRYLHLAITRDQLNESWHVSLMRLYLQSGRPENAIRQFRALEEVLREELRAEPSEEAKVLAAEASQLRPHAELSMPEIGFGEPPDTPSEIVPEPEEPIQAVRLPVVLTRFIGREAEIDVIVREFDVENCRAMSILGAAGCGKTRLAIEASRALAERGWNVWFVPLADLNNPAHLLDRVADTMRVRNPRESAIESIANANLSGDGNLVILNNVDVILDGALPAIRTLLSETPFLRVMITSRHAPKIGEQVLNLDPLPTPDRQITRDLGRGAVNPQDVLARLSENACVQIFVDRSQKSRADFQLTANNARHISHICEEMEGLPLALEIAAGLSSVFTPAQLDRMISSRLTVLANHQRGIPPRHRSMRAAIDYSFRFLRPEVQKFFCALSVFPSSFTVVEAEDVCLKWLNERGFLTGEPGQPSLSICHDMLLDLIDRSMVFPDGGDGDSEIRFRMLDIYREFAADTMGDADMRSLRDRYATAPISSER